MATQENDSTIFGKEYAMSFCIAPLFICSLLATVGSPTYQRIILGVVAWLICYFLYQGTVMPEMVLSRTARYWLLFIAQILLITVYYVFSVAAA